MTLNGIFKNNFTQWWLYCVMINKPVVPIEGLF